MGIANEIEQVLTNLLVNARDAIRKASQGGRICVRTRLENSFLVLEVCDNGIGISKDKIHKIFDPFFTTKEVGAGTGLGLAISYGIIQKHGGDISVQSTEGLGTTFLIRFPSVASMEPA